MKLDRINTIIFDLGGVIFFLDYALCEKSFKKIGVKDFELFKSELSRMRIFERFEEGDITPEEFRALVKPFCSREVTDAEIDAAWNTLIGDAPVQSIETLQKLRKEYTIFLLSNTNETHIIYCNEYLTKKYNTTLEQLFDKTYYSYELGMSKPSVGIFQHIVQETGIDPRDALFIDDTLLNLNAAETLGIKTIQVKTPLEMAGYFQESPD